MIGIQAKEIKIVDIDSLIPNPKNNNRHPVEQYERLKKIIKKTGFRVPIEVSNRSGFVVCGHLRLEVAKQLDMKQVPVIYQEFENEAIEYAHMTAENEIARWSELDKHAILTEVHSDNFEIDFDLLGLSFDIQKLDLNIDMPDDLDESDQPEKEKKYLLEIQLPNEMELRDLYDDLTSKGYMVKEK